MVFMLMPLNALMSFLLFGIGGDMSKPTGQAPCKNVCEAKALELTVRQLKRRCDELHEQNLAFRALTDETLVFARAVARDEQNKIKAEAIEEFLSSYGCSQNGNHTVFHEHQLLEFAEWLRGSE